MSSIEPDVDVHLYGSSQRHLIDTVQNIGKYDQLDTFDIIILNKVHVPQFHAAEVLSRSWSAS